MTEKFNTYFDQLFDSEGDRVDNNEKISDFISPAIALVAFFMSPGLLTFSAVVISLIVPLYFTHLGRGTIEKLSEIQNAEFKKDGGGNYSEDELYDVVVKSGRYDENITGPINIHWIEIFRFVAIVIALFSIIT